MPLLKTVYGKFYEKNKCNLMGHFKPGKIFDKLVSHPFSLGCPFSCPLNFYRVLWEIEKCINVWGLFRMILNI